MAFLHCADAAFHGLTVSTQQGNRFVQRSRHQSSSLLSIGVLLKVESEKPIWEQAMFLRNGFANVSLVGFVV